MFPMWDCPSPPSTRRLGCFWGSRNLAECPCKTHLVAEEQTRVDLGKGA